MSRPGMRFVPIKSAENQAALMLVKVRDLLVKQRTMLINAMRGHAAEFGVIAAKGPVKVAELVQRAQDDKAGVPVLARALLRELAEQLAALNARLEAIDARLMAWHRHDPRSRLLASIPGVGPVGAVSFALKVPEPKLFRSGRHFAAWIGLTPKENATGGRRRPGAISRQSLPLAKAGGDESLRRLLVLGATTTIRFAKPGKTSPPAFARAGSGCSTCWAQAQEAGGGRAGQQNGPHHLGHARQRRALPAAAAGLNRAARHHTWRLRGQQQDGDRSVRGSEQPVGSCDAQTSLLCLRPDPRHPSGPAANCAAHTGRTYDRNRPDPPRCTALARPGPSTYGPPLSRGR
jgi:hypothetical protein